MEHEQKSGAVLLRLLRLLWLLPHSWAVLEGKTLAALLRAS
jgi:major histocompatibility complex class II